MARRFTLGALVLLAALLAGIVLTARMPFGVESAGTSQPPADASPTETATGPAEAQRPVAVAPAAGLPDLTAIAERAVGSVTNISSTTIVRGARSPFASDPFFRYFFGDDDPFGSRDRRAQSLGSGVVVSPDGYLLTNNHVVGNADAQVSVVLADKREVEAQIVGVDDWTDIAVLKIDAQHLSTLPWGDSSKLKVAEWVLAIGNPFQLNQTVTLGIVSATGRSLEGRLATYEDFIQTDAAINPGNSGGALINARGELVGINTAIYSESGGYQGIGFAVPSNLARHVMDDIIKYGSVRRGTIPGIQVQQLTTMLAERLGAPNARGALVYAVDPRADAARDLKPGDIIVSFDETAVDDVQQFIRLLSDASIGSAVRLGVIRDGRRSTVRVEVAQASGRTGRRR
jgi:Do/DeqQ family serine protease